MSRKSFVRYAGTLRFTSPAILAAVLSLAATRLDDDNDDSHRLAWQRGLVPNGATLSVEVAGSPLPSQRFAAAAVLEALAEHAQEGGVEVREGDSIVDFFVPKARPLV
ncbi:MAG TPA: hypothetical protein VGM88_24955 [Kofleriaceae bacterium]|jgi:hypothetical protein